MSKRQNLIAQLDELMSMPVSGEEFDYDTNSGLEDRTRYEQDSWHSQDFDEGEESSDDTNFIGSYFDSESINSAKSGATNETNETSIGCFESGEGEGGEKETGFPMRKSPRFVRRDNGAIHRKLDAKDGNLHNVLDCLHDMLEQETLMIQEELHNFIVGVETSVANNTYTVPLFRKTRK